MAYFGGRYFGPRYFGPRYWGSKQVELPPGSISGSALGAATANGNLTALGHMTATSDGLAAAMANLSARGHMTGSADGSSTATGLLTDGGGGLIQVNITGSSEGSATVTGLLTFTGTPEAPPEHISTGSGGPAGKARRRKRRKLTVEEELELARARGALRNLSELWSSPEESPFLPWEEIAEELEEPVAPPRMATSAFASSGPAFSGTVDETDSFEKIPSASRVVVERLMAEAQARAAQIFAQRRAQEDDEDEDDIEMLLLFF